MTHEHDHDPEPEIVTRTTAEAQRTIQKVVTLLQHAGWDAVIISVSRAVQVGPDDIRAPGATATVINVETIGPVRLQLAEVMRKQAAALEASARADGQAVEGGYIQDRTDYAGGAKEWPR